MQLYYTSTFVWFQVLTAPALAKANICVFLNKTDITGAMTRAEIVNILRLEQIANELYPRVTILEGSASTGAGLNDVTSWISNNAGKTQT